MPTLRVELRVVSRDGAAPGEAAAEAIFTNPSEQATPFGPAQASHPSLVLEVQDDKGQRVLLPPPSVPDPKDLVIARVAPGDSVTIRYAGILGQRIAGGRYRVRYHGEHPALGGTKEDPLESDWVEIAIRPAARPEPTRVGRKRAARDASLGERVRGCLICFLEFLVDRLRRCPRTWAQEVDVERTETISDAPPGSEAWNGDYAWQARFHVGVLEAICRVTVTVRVRLSGEISASERLAWESAIEHAWSNLFKLCCPSECCPDGYTIVADIQFVSSGEHQLVNVGDDTTDMGNWGRSDAVDVRHEFGHMLGALDEYFTVNGVPWGDGRQPDGSIMNNPANPPEARHYDLVRQIVDAQLGTTCPATPVADPC